MILPVILSGGAGTRLWPVSRESLPKPFLAMPDGQTLLQKALVRARSLPGVDAVLTVTHRDLFLHTRDAYATVAPGADLRYLLEPVGRNTTPAIAMAAHLAVEAGDPVLVVLAADHLVEDLPAFSAAASRAIACAGEGRIALFGVRPDRSETGFGYIELGAPGPHGSHHVRRFVEKPDPDTATTLLDSGCLWNSGMICVRASVFLTMLAKARPALAASTKRAWDATRTGPEPRTIPAVEFGACEDVSVDVALLEVARDLVVIPAQFGWSDIGSWSAVAKFVAADQAGNRVEGDGVLVASSHCYVRASTRPVALVGCEGLLVIDTPDAVLVTSAAQEQRVNEVVTRLRGVGHEAARQHVTSHRPWGNYTVLETGPRFKIKRLVVHAGASLSLQVHHHRSEHWVVVSGTAAVRRGDTDHLLHANESTFIPVGTPHRLSNPGKIDCVIIEVQSGDYLGEDDIVRLEDNYGR